MEGDSTELVPITWLQSAVVVLHTPTKFLFLVICVKFLSLMFGALE